MHRTSEHRGCEGDGHLEFGKETSIAGAVGARVLVSKTERRVQRPGNCRTKRKEGCTQKAEDSACQRVSSANKRATWKQFKGECGCFVDVRAVTGAAGLLLPLFSPGRTCPFSLLHACQCVVRWKEKRAFFFFPCVCVCAQPASLQRVVDQQLFEDFSLARLSDLAG